MMDGEINIGGGGMKIWRFLVGGEGRRTGGSGEEILDKLFKLLERR